MKPDQVSEIEGYADHLIFNSMSQWRRFAPLLAERPTAAYGLRINPRHSEVETPLYDPCAARSRLGALVEDLTEETLAPLGGLHVHGLCDHRSISLVEILFHLLTDFVELHISEFNIQRFQRQ